MALRDGLLDTILYFDRLLSSAAIAATAVNGVRRPAKARRVAAANGALPLAGPGE